MLYSLLKPLLFRFDAERVHDLTSRLLALSGQSSLARGLLRVLFAYDHPALATRCAELDFANPLGLAAGFDKRGILVTPMVALGFGHVEIGTVTPRPQPGNDKPRLFRLPEDRALINRLGFNSPGMVTVARHLRRTLHNQTSRLIEPTPGPHRPIIGVNIGKNRTTPLERAEEDYVATLVALAPLANYITVNISSPNTPGLRRLHEREALAGLLGTLAAVNARLPTPRPLFLKVSPDESPAQLDEVVEVALAHRITGLIATNTTLDRNNLTDRNRAEAGGLSGHPLAVRARAVIAHLYRITSGQVSIIGVGGIAGPDDAYAHIRAGATLVQLYTGLVYEGPGLPYRITRGLVTLLERDGFASVADAVGADHI
jgi:dihydroorotate dehydrogenase